MKSQEFKGEFTGRHMFVIMLCFFSIILAVNIVMATIASKSWTGLVVESSYVASQEYNSVLEAAKTQNERGWRSELSYSNGIFEIKLTNAQNEQLNAGIVSIKVGRPACEQDDHILVLTANGKGYFTSVDRLAEGVWILQITADIDGRIYHRNVRIFVTHDGKGLVQ